MYCDQLTDSLQQVFIPQEKEAHLKRITPLAVSGFIDRGDGLGRQSVELIRAFPRHFAHLLPTRPLYHSLKATAKALLKGNWKRAFERMIDLHLEKKYRGSGESDYLIHMDSLPSLLKVKKGIHIAYSLFETTAIPSSWVENLNTHFDAVIVADPFFVEVYKKSGVTLPVFSLPLGLDLTPFLSAPLKKKRGARFIFGNFSTCTPRKNLIGLVEVWQRVFSHSTDVELRINARYGDRKTIEELLTTIKAPNITFRLKSLSSSEYLKALSEVDCLVNFSKGEGFSIQPREAMALGIPALITNNTAQKTIVKSGLVKGINSTVSQPAFYPGSPWLNEGVYGDYFDFCREEGAEALFEMVEQYDTYLEKAQAAREWARGYDYTSLRPLYQALFDPSKAAFGEEEITASHLLTTSQAYLEKAASILERRKKRK